MSAANRTKGNVKPSNSERAARLLPTNQFVSFSQASQTLSSIYSANNTNDASTLELGLSPEFQGIFKHMTKKDINTKLKALQDFTTLCRSKDVDDLLKISNFWFRVYRKLANTIDWRVRHDVHEANYSFISQFKPSMIIDSIRSMNVPTNSESFETCFSAEVSFQSLITMPAILWNSCYDGYHHSAKTARKSFDYLYPNVVAKIEFILENYETVINYCLFCLFDKVPINLFYNTALPEDSVMMFEEHLLVTSLLGLSTMIDELLCAYLNPSNSDSRIKDCLFRIFTRVNNEFIRCKNIPMNSNEKVQEEQGDSTAEVFMSRKEKKKQKKDAKNMDSSKGKAHKGGCKFWAYFKSASFTIQTAFFRALNSITRMTTALFEDEEEKLLQWFQLYKINFYENILNSLSHQLPEIRGLSWLLTSHLLANTFLYNPWTVIKKDVWLKSTLLVFVSNGMKPPGSVLDFGLQNIDFLKFQHIYSVYSQPKASIRSKFELFDPSSVPVETLENQNLLITFIESFTGEDCLQIYTLFFTGLEDAFKNAVLQKDVDFLVELYFTLVRKLMKDFAEKEQLKSLVEDVFQNRLYNLLVNSLSANQLLSRSQLYGNLLSLVHFNDSVKDTPAAHQILQDNLSKLYLAVLSECKSCLRPHQPEAALSALCFLTDSVQLNFDGYFSPAYYSLQFKFDYQKNIRKLFRAALSGFKLDSKSVNFESSETVKMNLDFNLLNSRFVKRNEKIFFPLESLKEVSIEQSLEHLLAFVDSQFAQLKLDDKNGEVLFVTLHHLQYLLRLSKQASFNQKLHSYCFKWIDCCYQHCLKTGSLTRLSVIIGWKIIDLLLLSQITFGEQIAGESTLFLYFLKINHLNHLASNPEAFSEDVAKKIENLLSTNLETDCFESIVLRELDSMFNNTTNQSNLQYDILSNVLQFIKRNVPTKELFEFFTEILHRFYSRLSCSLKLDYRYVLEYPLLCMQLYKFLFQNLAQLSSSDKMLEMFEKFASLSYRQLFSLLSQPTSNHNSQFIDNSLAFCLFAFECMFANHLKPVGEFSKLVDFLFKDVINKAARNNYESLNTYIVKLVSHSLECSKRIGLSEESTKSLVEKANQIQTNIAQIVHGWKFTTNNVIAELYQLEQCGKFEKLYAIRDLFYTELNTLASFSDVDQFNRHLQAKHCELDDCIYQSLTLLKIVSILLEKFYLEKSFKKSLQSDSTVQLFDGNVKTFFESKCFTIIRNMIHSVYYFEKFISFYEFHSGQLSKICAQFKEELIAVVDLIQRNLKQNSLSEFVTFIICSDSRVIPSLSLAHYCMEVFFPKAICWMDILNHIGLETQPNPNLYGNITWLYMANMSSIEKMILIVDRAINLNKIKKVAEEDSNTPIEWASIDTDQINQTLFIVNMALKKLSPDCDSQENITELKGRLVRFLTELAISELDSLFEPSMPSLNNQKFVTFLLCSEMLSESILKLDEELQDVHLSLVISLLKMVIQLLYTTMPEGLETGKSQKISELLLANQFLHTLNTVGLFAQKSFNTVEKNSSREELFRNFLAFNSFNLLIPLFVVMSSEKRTHPSNMLERVFFDRLSECMYCVDSECLANIVQFEPNQYLLMNPYNDFFEASIQKELSEFFQNVQSKSIHKLATFGSHSSRYKHLVYENSYYDYILKYGMSLMLHENLYLSLSSYHLLSVMIATASWSCKSSTVDSPSEKGTDTDLTLDLLHIQDEIQTGPPRYLCELLEKLDKVVHYCLLDYEFGESVLIEQSIDVYKYTFVYLLGWLLYIDLVKRFSGDSTSALDTRASLINYISERGMHSRLFENLFHLMATEESKEENEEGQLVDRYNICQYPEKLRKLIGEESSSSVSKLASCVYYQVLNYLPDVIRSWFNNLKHHQKQIVDCHTLENFSNILIEKEFDCFKLIDHKLFGNINVKASKKLNEITAVYSLKEISFGMKFSFNANFPLTAVRIECINRSGVSEDRCRKWIQRLTIFFNKMNCSIANSIIMLRSNMDKFFEGIDECMICLFVLYGATSQLPRFKCPQCKKKFHWACIRKWFQTNHTSNCPQCKFEFN